MLSRKMFQRLALVAAAFSLSAFVLAADKPLSPTTAEQSIKERQDNFKQIGGAFKTIRDEVRARNSNMDAIVDAANTINALAQELPTWFPAGTGPEAGVETEALPIIWNDQTGFAAAAQRLVEASGSLQLLAQSGDASKVNSGIPTLGGACKNCHDNYRED